MKKIRIFLACVFISICWVQNISAYNLTTEDMRVISEFEKILFPLIDEKWEVFWGRVLDKISAIQDRRITKKTSIILDAISGNIDEKYAIWKYIVASENIPLLKTPDFKAQFWGIDGNTLNFDRFWEIDAVEHIAPVWTVFTFERDMWDEIYQVSTKSYPVNNPLYIHKDFVESIRREKPKNNQKIRPSRNEIIQKLRSIEWADYVWGGNIPWWIPRLRDIFPPSWKISLKKKQEWTLTWVDCSGLLYWGSNGTTPRNTSWLVEHGERLDIAGKSLDEILTLLEPLDVIVWKWHMMIVLSKTETIESAVSYSDSNLSAWVQIRDTRDSLGEVLQKRTPVNNYTDSQNSPFVIMRWYPEN